MTLGFAFALWTADEPRVMVASDSRISAGGEVLSDVGVKTYELGGACAAVAAGAARPTMMAAEVTRSTIDTHNRLTPDRPLNFLSTVRIFSYFLKRISSNKEPPIRVAVAGFLGHGRTPCVAQVTISPGFNKVAFISCLKGEAYAVPVGNPDGQRLLLQSIAAAKRAGRRRGVAAIAALQYMAKLSGAYPTIGGGIAVGYCMGGEKQFTWPLIEIDGRRYLRGIDVTDSFRPTWPKPDPIDYDEDWLRGLDEAGSVMDNTTSLPHGGSMAAIDIDEIDPASVFQDFIEPPEWETVGSLTRT